jgi:hypothetical protein
MGKTRAVLGVKTSGAAFLLYCAEEFTSKSHKSKKHGTERGFSKKFDFFPVF